MADTKTYRVLRPLDGDRAYKPGDTRTMLPSDAKALVAMGALAEDAGDAPAPVAPEREPDEAVAPTGTDANPPMEPIIDSREAADLGVKRKPRRAAK